MDNKLLDIANKHYTDPAPVILIGDHKEQAIIVSPSTDMLVLVDTPNELSNGDTSNQAQSQVFWNDAGAIQVCIEHYAPSLAQIASQVS